MQEQKSFNDLIQELNKVVKEYGYDSIKSIAIDPTLNPRYTLTYTKLI